MSKIISSLVLYILKTKKLISNIFFKIKDLQKNNSDAKNNISTLEQLLCLKEDVNSQLDFAKDRVKQPFYYSLFAF